MTAPTCKGCGRVIIPRDEPGETRQPVRMGGAWWHVTCAEDEVAGHEADERENVEIREAR